MTDTLGQDPQDRDEAASLEADKLQDAADPVTEAPSDYEFADESVPEEDFGEKTNRRSPLLPIVAAIGGIALLGVVAWWHLGAEQTSSPVVSVSQVADVSESGAFAISEEAQSSDAKGVAAEASSDRSVALKADSVVPTTMAAGASEPFAPASSVATPSSSQENIIPAIPSVLGDNEGAIPSGAAVEDLFPADVVKVQPSQEDVRRIDELSSRVAGLQKELAQAMRQLNDLTNAFAASATSSRPASAGSDEDLKARINSLEKKIEILGRPETTKAIVITEPEKKAAVLPGNKTTKITAAVKAPAKKATKSQAVAPKPIPRKQWVLRAAAPGRAWVAVSNTSQELKEIQVGDALEGIGKVSSIEGQGDKWIVRGSKGILQ